MTIPDTTIVRLWPIPRMFQLFFIFVVAIALGVTAWSLVALVMETPPAYQGIDCESGCINTSSTIAQDHASMTQGARIDSDILIGVVIAPLVIGAATAIATPGRNLLGRVWYGALFVVIAIFVWFGVKILYYTQSSMVGTLSADEPFLSEPTLVSVAVMTVYAMIDAWWQRRRYVWMRAWSLLFFEVVLIALAGYSMTESMQASDTFAVVVLAGVTTVLVLVTFFVFWRRTIHLAAKFAGLLLALSLLGGYLAGMAEQSLYNYEYVWTAAAIGAVLTYGLGMWMIGTRPIPLKR